MKVIADLHIHGRFSRATSKALDFENLEKYARLKGVGLLGTGDFTHPTWFSEIKKLQEDSNGIFFTKNKFPFVLQGEISLIYSQDGKGRRVHLVLLAPDSGTVEQINTELLKIGRTDYDGRPIFGINCVDFTEKMMSINKDIEIIPAHVWTPWFSIFGSNSGFNSVEECFKDQSKHVHALETGMSSDPAMNWRISKLDKYTLLSNSDLHSFWPWRIGREANVFDLKELSYKNIVDAIRTRNGLVETIEVDPGYGKYHIDGHRKCNVSMEPKDALKNNNICPVCKRELTIGVLHRVEELADRPEGFVTENAVPFKTLIPLSEIISALIGTGIATKKTWAVFYDLINKFGSEFNVLLDAPEEELKKVVDEKLVEAILKNREGKIEVKPGFDGEYGRPILGDVIEEEKPKVERKQKGLGEFM
ncbi:MAG: DNA helicase UvrD [bacterium]|nr:DNA helicase UvrD [bacterium]